jgi:hypothetical protein
MKYGFNVMVIMPALSRKFPSHLEKFLALPCNAYASTLKKQANEMEMYHQMSHKCTSLQLGRKGVMDKRRQMNKKAISKNDVTRTVLN